MLTEKNTLAQILFAFKKLQNIFTDPNVIQHEC
jgi:hypothetical protein